MALSEFQKEMLLCLYAESIEFSPSEENWVDKIVELWNAFSCDIPDWQNRIRAIFEEKAYSDALSALDSALVSDKYIKKTNEDGDCRRIRYSWAPYFRPKAEVEGGYPPF